MPPKTKAVPIPDEPRIEETADIEAESAPARPTHTSELCKECGHTELHPSVTAFGCEHGTWVFDL